MNPFVSQPTATELAAAPTIRLTSDRHVRAAWVPWGFRYPIRFNKSGEGFVLETHFDAWIGQELADSMGMTVTRMTAGTDATRAVTNDQADISTARTVTDDQPI